MGREFRGVNDNVHRHGVGVIRIAYTSLVLLDTFPLPSAGDLWIQI